MIFVFPIFNDHKTFWCNSSVLFLLLIVSSCCSEHVCRYKHTIKMLQYLWALLQCNLQLKHVNSRDVWGWMFWKSHNKDSDMV